MLENSTSKELQQRINELEREAVEAKRSQEKRLTRLNTLLQAVRNMRQLLGREKDALSLLKCACDILTGRRGYHHAWTALIDESGKIVFAGQSGLDENLLPVMELLKRGELPFCSRKALEQRDLIVIKDSGSICDDCPLAGSYGGGGAMNIPLAYAGKIYGLISACMPKYLVLYEEEQALFREIADDIGYALHNIGSKERRQKKGVKSTLDSSMRQDRSTADLTLYANQGKYVISSFRRAC